MSVGSTDVSPVERDRVGSGSTLRRASRFVVVGGVSAALDVGLLVLLRDVVGTATGLAASVAFWAALLVNFTLHRSWSFADGDRRRDLAGSAARYGVLVVGGWVVTVVLVVGAETIGVPYLLGKLVALAAVACVTFVAYDRWVFR